jgi:prophage regulatory protein
MPRAIRGVATSLSQEGFAMTRKLISKKELKTVYGIPYCFAHIARLEAASLFPKRVRLGACRVAWYAEEIEEWIDSRPRASAA